MVVVITYSNTSFISGGSKRDKGWTDPYGTVVCLSLKFNWVFQRVFSNPYAKFQNPSRNFSGSNKAYTSLDMKIYHRIHVSFWAVSAPYTSLMNAPMIFLAFLKLR